MNHLWRKHLAFVPIHAVHRTPIWALSQPLIDVRGRFQMRQICFLQIVPPARIASRVLFADHGLCFRGGQAQINHDIFARQAVDAVFQLLEPAQKFRQLPPGNSRALMRQVRADVTVRKNHFPVREIFFKLRFVLQTVARIEQRRKMRVHFRQVAEFAVQIPRDHAPKKPLVTRKTDRKVLNAAFVKRARKHFELRALAGAVDSLERDEFPTGRHQSGGQSNIFDNLASFGERREKQCRLSVLECVMPRAATIASNVEQIRERIARAAARADRRPEEVVLVAAAKTVSAEAIRAAYDAGVRAFGENRVQEWEEKQPQLTDLKASWHLIGHLQGNKARRAARLFDWIDSVDSAALALKLDDAAGETNEWLAVLIEVQLDPAEKKSGVAQADLPALAEAIGQMPHLELRGLMAIPPFCDDPRDSRPHFRRLRRLRDDLEKQFDRSLPELSMGMSHDFEIAIEEGATQVRLGTAIFGERAKE